MLGSVNPASSANLVRDAHYHPIRATETWAAFVASMMATATEDPERRAAEDRARERETTYARGELGRH